MKNLLASCKDLGTTKPLTTEENNALYERLLLGDTAAINEMIEGNMALVILRVQSFVAVYPTKAYLWDDLISQGLLGLTVAVNRLAISPRGENPKGYIYTAISNHLEKLCEAEEAELATPCDDLQVPLPGNPCDAVDLMDFIMSCAETDLERRLITLLSEGYTLTDAAEEIGKSLSYVCEIRTELYRRYERKLAKLDD